MIEYKQKNLFESVAVEDIRVNGKIGELMDTFFRERVLCDFARNTIYQETEDAYHNQTDGDGPAGIFQGEFWGKWVISAARVSRYYHDDELKEFLIKAAHNMMELQREDGYIGTYKDSANVFAADPKVTEPIMGWPCDWNWNIWCRKYTLWGLIEVYQLTGKEDILNSTIRFADQLINELQEKNINIAHTGTFDGLASCSIMKPMLILYRITGNEKYLNFCLDIAHHWETEKPGLIVNSLALKELAQWYDDMSSWAKVYESLSCFDGLLELYRVTGDKKYLDTTECFYELLEKYEKNLLFSIGYNDQYRSAAKELNALSEPCDVIHYIRVCYELFKLTGKVKYLDTIELCYYNPMLASPCKDGTWGARTVRGAGRHGYAHNQASMQYSHCCVNNVPRGLLNAAECAVMTNGDELFINLYHDYDAAVTINGKRVAISSKADYIGDSRAKLYIDSVVDFAVRIPEWSNSAMVIVNGKQIKAESGFLHVKAADIAVADNHSGIEIEIIFDDTVHIKQFTKPVPQYTAADWQYRRWASKESFENNIGRTFQNSARCILQKGATLLCRSKLIGNTAEEMFDGNNLINGEFKCTLEKCKTDSDVQAQWIASFSNGEKSFSTKVCDYAFAANMEHIDSEYFSIYF